MILLLLSLLLASRQTVDVDVIELNHVYSLTESRDEMGRVKLKASFVASYWLVWAWTNEGLHVMDWVKDGPATVLYRRTLTVVVKRRVIHIRGKTVQEIASLTDRERDDSQEYPIGKRSLIEGLRK